MPLYSDEAIVLRTHKLAEADRIITLLTRQHGIVRARKRLATEIFRGINSRFYKCGFWKKMTGCGGGINPGDIPAFEIGKSAVGAVGVGDDSRDADGKGERPRGRRGSVGSAGHGLYWQLQLSSASGVCDDG